MERKRVSMCVVTQHKSEVSLGTAISLVKFQTALTNAPDLNLSVEVHFATTLDDALHVLWQSDAYGMCVINGSVSFDPEFALDALRSNLDFVVGCYPLPVVRWDRVAEQSKTETTEPVKHWGNEYNVSLKNETSGQYRLVDTAAEVQLGLAWISKNVLDTIVTRHHEIIDLSGRPTFALEGVFDSRRVSGDRRFLDLWAGPVWADTERPASCMGLTEFGGCVGARRILR